jgi:DNA-binding transcriptional MocR family regulator
MVLKYTVPATQIDLQRGWPSTRLHPLAAVASGAQTVFPAHVPDADGSVARRLQYGPGQGEAALRASLAAWLTAEYAPTAGPVDAGRLAVTNGASNALATVLQKFTDAGAGYTRAVWVVEPTYYLACAILRDAGFVGPGRVRAVPEGPTGVDLAFLRAALEAVEAREVAAMCGGGDGGGDFAERDRRRLHKTPALGYPRVYRHVLYMVPTFSNPSGRTMGLADRRALVRLAREFDMLLVTDDVYDVLRWCPGPDEAGGGCACRVEVDEDGRHPHLVSSPRLVDVDRAMPGQTPFGNAVSNGSFSKIVAPGVRVGWAEAAPLFAKTLAQV